MAVFTRIMKRKLQHRSLTQQQHQNVSQYQLNTALGQHVRNTGHSIDFKDVRILTQDPKPYRLMIKESIQIRSRKAELKGTDTSLPLYVFPEGNRLPQSKEKHNQQQNNVHPST